MADIDKLRTELSDDPLGRGYAGMSDREAADDLNTKYRQEQIRSMAGDTMFSSTVLAEFVLLTERNQNLWMSICGRATVDPWSNANLGLLEYIYGPASSTEDALAAIAVQMITREAELGIGYVREGDVTQARATL
jgi:hypothetical protein